MPQKHLQLLGSVQVSWESGMPPRFRSQRTMALLGYLVAEKRPFSRDYLAALFWPDEEPSIGKGNLRRELHNLGQILPGCWHMNNAAVKFVSNGETIVDIDTLSRLDQDEQWTDAAVWVSGEFLEGHQLEDNPEFEAWLLGERERWRQRAERVLMQAALFQKQQGNYPDARRCLARLLQFIPWYEEGHRQMMRLLAQSGQLSAALKQYDQCRTILSAELDVLPAVATTRLYESIKLAQLLPPSNLPPPVTPFIGREAEGAALRRHMTDPDCRLLTLTGVGGIGKSRLALQAARQMSGDNYRQFLHGVAFVPLVGVDRQDLITAVGSALGLAFAGSEPAERQLLHYLKGAELLLLLDNYEHLLPETALLAAILREAPAVKLLVTSRERLKLQEEWLYEVSGLPYPERLSDEPTDEPQENGELDYAAVRLFAACARRGRPAFSLAQNGRDVAEICRLVQGMPLALELLSAQLHHLTPADLLTELGGDLDIMTADAANAAPRHASLRVVFDASWAGLSAAEQQVLSRLSLFRGGFTRPAAVEVAAATPAILLALTNKSLTRHLPSGRYEMHELLRQYAAANLAADSILDQAAQEQYALYYGTFLQQREQRLLETHQEETLREIVPEIDNIRLAWRWLVQHEKIAILGNALWTLASFYQLQGMSHEGLALVEETLSSLPSLDDQKPQQGRLRVRLYLFQALFSMWQGRDMESRLLLEHNLVQVRRWGSPQDMAWALSILGEILGATLSDPGCFPYLREGVAIAQSAGLRWLEAFISARLANFLFAIGSVEVPEESEQLLLRTMTLTEKLENPFALLNVFLVYGRLAQYQGDYLRAEHAFEQALTAARRINHLWLMSIMLLDSGKLNYRQGNYAKAWHCYEESSILALRTGSRWREAALLHAQGQLARAESEPSRAQRYYQDSLAVYQKLDAVFDRHLVYVYCSLGYALLAQSHLDRAANFFRQSLVGMNDSQDRMLVCMALAGLSGVLVARGQAEGAARLAGAAQVHFAAVPRHLEPADRQDWEHIQAEIRRELDEASFASAWAAGRAMTLDEATRLALAGNS